MAHPRVHDRKNRPPGRLAHQSYTHSPGKGNVSRIANQVDKHKAKRRRPARERRTSIIGPTGPRPSRALSRQRPTPPKGAQPLARGHETDATSPRMIFV
ncbi:hypothetical protein HPB47_024725 [Ixodes persulcatus]|uniref:Uncharacterized protein n=1 Tax=Ixodes persulcatus TaxID=34615 RepID=A0AC60Q3M1_IXOPE|nr:hypothetical protein HPB47_024725 [Ixodes persulcatus]